MIENYMKSQYFKFFHKNLLFVCLIKNCTFASYDRLAKKDIRNLHR